MKSHSIGTDRFGNELSGLQSSTKIAVAIPIGRYTNIALIGLKRGFNPIKAIFVL